MTLEQDLGLDRSPAVQEAEEKATAWPALEILIQSV